MWFLLPFLFPSPCILFFEKNFFFLLSLKKWNYFKNLVSFVTDFWFEYIITTWKTYLIKVENTVIRWAKKSWIVPVFIIIYIVSFNRPTIIWILIWGDVLITGGFYPKPRKMTLMTKSPNMMVRVAFDLDIIADWDTVCFHSISRLV